MKRDWGKLDSKTRSRVQGEAWAKENPEKKKKLYRASCTKAKVEALTYYGKGKLSCVKCGFDDVRALSIDHIKGRGELHREDIKRRGSMLYFWLRSQNFPSGYQTLCMNCQFIKRMVNRECSGKRVT